MATTLYTRQGCAHCDELRRALHEAGRRFVEIDLTEHPEAVPELLKLTRGRRIVPVLVDGARIAIAPDGGAEF